MTTMREALAELVAIYDSNQDDSLLGDRMERREKAWDAARAALAAEEPSKLQNIALAPCAAHMNQSFTFAVSVPAVPPRMVCPICEPDWQEQYRERTTALAQEALAAEPSKRDWLRGTPSADFPGGEFYPVEQPAPPPDDLVQLRPDQQRALLSQIAGELKDARAEVERLRAENEALRPDAEAYRRLRQDTNWPAVFPSWPSPENRCMPLRGAELDAAMKRAP